MDSEEVSNQCLPPEPTLHEVTIVHFANLQMRKQPQRGKVTLTVLKGQRQALNPSLAAEPKL